MWLFHEKSEPAWRIHLPIQLDNFSIPSKTASLPSSDVAARAVAQPQIENNIRLDAVFKKPLYIARKLVGHGDKKSFAVIAAVPVEQHIITAGSTSLLKSYSLESRSHFRQAPAKSRGRMLSMHQLKALFLKRPGILSKSIYYPHSSVPTILSNYFALACMHFAVALEADGGVELLRGSVIAARQ